MRQRIKYLQSQRINELNLLELDELVDGLRIIDCKLLYQKEVLEAASQLALDEHDKSLSAKFFVALLIVETIIEVCILYLCRKINVMSRQITHMLKG